MPDPRPTLLLTRPEAQSRRFGTMFQARFGADWPMVISPLMEIVPLSAQIPAADALIFTSEPAISAFLRLETARGRRAYCVGMRTARVAQEAGFAPVIGPGDAQGLLALIKAEHQGGILLHPRGEHVAHNMAQSLNSAGIETVERVVYTQLSMGLSERARALLTVQIALLIPLFSPRSSALFALEAREADARMLFAPISRTAAEPLHGLPNARIEIAEEPDASGVMSALSRLIRPFRD